MYADARFLRKIHPLSWTRWDFASLKAVGGFTDTENDKQESGFRAAFVMLSEVETSKKRTRSKIFGVLSQKLHCEYSVHATFVFAKNPPTLLGEVGFERRGTALFVVIVRSASGSKRTL